MQLVERGKLSLDEPVAKLRNWESFRCYGFDRASRTILKPATKDVTLRNLVTHRSGFCDAVCDKQMFEWQFKVDLTATNVRAGYPLAVRHGTPLGRAVGGELQRHNTGRSSIACWRVAPARQADGTLKEKPRTSLRLPKRTRKAAASNSMTADYARFMQMILHKGAVATGRASWKRRRRS
jgi:CubicO group peptidase (beta-lactamase class C family)